MNALDRNLDGCCVRGLPIGRPFRARFELQKDYEASFTDTTDVFILLRYKDMQGGEILDLVDDADKQEIPSETKENTLKRRILNRQNINKERTSEKTDNEIEDSDADVDSVTIEELKELHVDSDTGTYYYIDTHDNSIIDRSADSNLKPLDLFDSGQTAGEKKSEDGKENDEDSLYGTAKIIQALLCRQENDKNMENEAAKTNAVDIDHELVVQEIKERKVETAEERNFKEHIKRKRKQDSTEVKKTKVKKVEDTGTKTDRRVSHRLRSAGFRPDYEAMAKSVKVNVTDTDEDTDGYDIDSDRVNGKKSKKSLIRKEKEMNKRSKRKDIVNKNNSESKTDDQDEKPDLEELNTVIKIKGSSSQCGNSRKVKERLKRKRVIKNKEKSDAFEVDIGTIYNDIDGVGAQRIRENNKNISDGTQEDNEIKDDPDVPDIEVTEKEHEKKSCNKRKSVENKTVVGNSQTDVQGENSLEKKVKKTRSRSELTKKTDHSSAKPKRIRKPKEPKIKDDKTEKTENEDDSSQAESDPELVGLARYQRNLLIARRKKLMEQQVKQAARIKVKLHEHTDKWKKDVMDSFMRKDRGKARYEVAVEMYMCTVCDKYKAESKESMENHIEMHVNGDLLCDHSNCSFVAVSNFELQKHKRDVHKKNIWICDLCGLETIGKEGLRDHLGRVHNSPQWSCKLCLKQDKKFASVTLHEHKKHLRAAHPESMFRCEGCKRLFAQQHKLDNHLRIGCEGDGSKSYSCEKCGKVFSSHDSVKRHIMRVHNKERSFQCPYCPFTAARQTNLTSHLNVHQGNPFLSVT